jgi:hypothetical protein
LTPPPALTPPPSSEITKRCKSTNPGHLYQIAVETAKCQANGCNAGVNDGRGWIDFCNSGEENYSCCATNEEVPQLAPGPAPKFERLTPYPSKFQKYLFGGGAAGLNIQKWQSITHADICNSGDDVLCPGGTSSAAVPLSPGYGSTSFWSIGSPAGPAPYWCFGDGGGGGANFSLAKNCSSTTDSMCSTGWVPNNNGISTQLCVKSCAAEGKTISSLYPTANGTQQCVCFDQGVNPMPVVKRSNLPVGSQCSRIMCSSTELNGNNCAINMGVAADAKDMGTSTGTNANRALLGWYLPNAPFDATILNACGGDTVRCDFG